MTVLYCIHICIGTAGGLIFGWNALAIMLKDQGNYNANCPPGDLRTLSDSECEMPACCCKLQVQVCSKVPGLDCSLPTKLFAVQT